MEKNELLIGARQAFKTRSARSTDLPVFGGRAVTTAML
jgi:hypothetical protein